MHTRVICYYRNSEISTRALYCYRNLSEANQNRSFNSIEVSYKFVNKIYFQTLFHNIHTVPMYTGLFWILAGSS